ncbi:hypothetical protein [Shewanella canadensis]|uniref:hypothetical protein n=1 Tax=Shewanella canadensis TaxID=271096 RepID=UPI0016397310|nr:hypothetical protein [Shewanella canadensis]
MTAKWKREQADTDANIDAAWKILDVTLKAASLAAELAPVHTTCSEFMGNVSCTSSKGY